MNLERVTIRHIKCFQEITLDFRRPDGGPRYWNVLIGENGTGKTALLQSIAIALMGEKAASVLLPRPRGWVRAGAEQGEIVASVWPGNLDTELLWEGDPGYEHLGDAIELSYQIRKDADGGTIFQEDLTEADQHRIERVRTSIHGWFAAGYGPFRRLGDSAQWVRSNREGYFPREARFGTLFREDAALTDCEAWLMQLDYAGRDGTGTEQVHVMLETVYETLNEYLLPDGVRLEAINSQGVFFRTPYAEKLRMSDLSDGYRAMLAFSIDLLRHLFQAFESEVSILSAKWANHISGIVLIDELDAHLHPAWQRKIGLWLQNRFPRLQFIVATHSPFIAQMADAGGLYVLRRPTETASFVEVGQDDESVRGWRVDQILTSDLFGLETTRAPQVEQELARYDDLLTKRATGQLTDADSVELARLAAALEQDIPPPGDTPAQRDRYRRMQEYITRTLEQE